MIPITLTNNNENHVAIIATFAGVLCGRATSGSSPEDPQDLARAGTGPSIGFHHHITGYHITYRVGTGGEILWVWFCSHCIWQDMARVEIRGHYIWV